MICGVPQGAIIPFMHFNIYVKPLNDNIHSFEVDVHQYADDIQLCSSLSKPLEAF